MSEPRDGSRAFDGLILALMFLHGVSGVQASVSAPFLMTWTTDDSVSSLTQGTNPAFQSTYGPDGPWQAVVVGTGNYSGASNVPGLSTTGALMQALYPCGFGVSQLLASEPGQYSLATSKSAVVVNQDAGQPVAWEEVGANSTGLVGENVFDSIQVGGGTGTAEWGGGSFTANASIYALTKGWRFAIPGGGTYTANVGALGLGRMYDPSFDSQQIQPPGILAQMQAAQKIPSESYGLHLGSVPLNTSGSLALGGYDRSRVVGPVGIFTYQSSPLAFLVDINLRTAVGTSAFAGGDVQQLYVSSDNTDSQRVLTALNAPRGATVVVPNPAESYIKLPPGNCANLAKHLPVQWDETLGFYLWNTSDPWFHSIVNSPAYVEFVLSDIRETNISIKVPLAHLNLTLDAPITTAPTPYFPCVETDPNEGVWLLGRAFLQSAFMAISFDQNITWIAQAPGPDAPAPSLLEILPEDTSIQSSPADTFQSSWSAHWTQISVGSPGFSANADPSPSTSMTPSSGPSLSGGAIAGIVIGSLLGLALVLGALWLLYRKRKQARMNRSGSHEPFAPMGQFKNGVWVGQQGLWGGKDFNEAPDSSQPSGAASKYMPAEVPDDGLLAEAPEGGLLAEAHGDALPAEADGNTRRPVVLPRGNAPPVEIGSSDIVPHSPPPAYGHSPVSAATSGSI